MKRGPAVRIGEAGHPIDDRLPVDIRRFMRHSDGAACWVIHSRRRGVFTPAERPETRSPITQMRKGQVMDTHDTTPGTPPDDPTSAIKPDDVADPADTRGKQGTRLALRSDRGATTAEYAITTLAACGFAALLVVILKSGPIKEAVTGIITTALKLGS